MSLRSFAGSLSFSHLRSIGRSAKKADDGEDTEAASGSEESGEDDEEMKAGDGGADDGSASGKDGKSGKGKSGKGDGAGDDGDEEDDPPPGDDEGDDEEDENAKAARKAEARAAARARKAERARWGAVLADASAAGNLELAATLLAGTDLNAKDILGAIAKAGTRPGRLAHRMAQAAQPRVPPGGTQLSGEAAIAKSWEAAAADFMPKH